MRFSKLPKTLRARKAPRKAPENDFWCFSKHANISDPRKVASFFPDNFPGARKLPKCVFGNAFFQLNGCVSLLLYQGKSYPNREFELIDKYWAKLKLKMSKNQEKNSENLTGLHALVRARTSYR